MIDYSTTAEIEFGDPETVKVSDLEVGDFVVSIPAQGQYRGYDVRSAVKAITDRPQGWYTQTRSRGPKFPIPSRVLTFVSVDLKVDVAGSFDVRVRRPITH